MILQKMCYTYIWILCSPWEQSWKITPLNLHMHIKNIFCFFCDFCHLSWESRVNNWWDTKSQQNKVFMFIVWSQPHNSIFYNALAWKAHQLCISKFKHCSFRFQPYCVIKYNMCPGEVVYEKKFSTVIFKILVIV